MKKAVIIDAGGVLIRATGFAARRTWEANRGHPEGFLDAVVEEAVGPGWAGGRSESEIHGSLVRLAGITEPELPGLLEVLDAHEEVDAAVAAALQSVRPRCRTAVLANAGPGRRAALEDRFHIDRLVDLIVISAEEKISKPDPRIYRSTAERLGVEVVDCLFVDDSRVNVEGAEAVGMTGLLFEDATGFSAALRRHIEGAGGAERP